MEREREAEILATVAKLSCETRQKINMSCDDGLERVSFSHLKTNYSGQVVQVVLGFI